jgi:signal transduction histidine kinase
MLNGLMTISRRSRPAMLIEDMDMNTVLAEAIGIIQAASGPLDVEVMPLPPCRADRASMVEVFVHLLRNAVRAGSPVTVSGQRGARLSYTVTDRGRGLSEPMRRRCFEMFTTDGPGDGIGLSLARHHVIRQRGWLRLWNIDDGGCRAEVSMPLHSSDEQT